MCMQRLLAQDEYRNLPTPARFETIVNGLMDDALQVCRGATGREIKEILLEIGVKHPIFAHRMIAHLNDSPGRVYGTLGSTRTLSTIPEAAGIEVEVTILSHSGM